MYDSTIKKGSAHKHTTSKWEKEQNAAHTCDHSLAICVMHERVCVRAYFIMMWIELSTRDRHHSFASMWLWIEQIARDWQRRCAKASERIGKKKSDTVCVYLSIDTTDRIRVLNVGNNGQYAREEHGQYGQIYYTISCALCNLRVIHILLVLWPFNYIYIYEFSCVFYLIFVFEFFFCRRRRSVCSYGLCVLFFPSSTYWMALL